MILEIPLKTASNDNKQLKTKHPQTSIFKAENFIEKNYLIISMFVMFEKKKSV